MFSIALITVLPTTFETTVIRTELTTDQTTEQTTLMKTAQTSGQITLQTSNTIKPNVHAMLFGNTLIINLIWDLDVHHHNYYK